MRTVKLKLPKIFCNQYIIIRKKIEDDYLMIFNLIKSTWKILGMTKDPISLVLFKLWQYIKANNNKGFYHRKTPQTRK